MTRRLAALAVIALLPLLHDAPARAQEACTAFGADQFCWKTLSPGPGKLGIMLTKWPSSSYRNIRFTSGGNSGAVKADSAIWWHSGTAFVDLRTCRKVALQPAKCREWVKLECRSTCDVYKAPFYLPTPTPQQTAEFEIRSCTEYVARAISQVQMGTGCPGVQGGRWTLNATEHMNWCSRAIPAQRAVEDAERRKALVVCTGRYPRAQIASCDEYAGRAMSQSDLQVSKACGYTGARWSRVYRDHYTWCERAPPADRAGEDEFRRNALADCRR